MLAPALKDSVEEGENRPERRISGKIWKDGPLKKEESLTQDSNEMLSEGVQMSEIYNDG